jgi:hypothetical protein
MIREDEFNEILEANKMFSEQLDRLKAENARLRGALEKISEQYDLLFEPYKGYAGNIAREALKGVE